MPPKKPPADAKLPKVVVAKAGATKSTAAVPKGTAAGATKLPALSPEKAVVTPTIDTPAEAEAEAAAAALAASEALNAEQEAVAAAALLAEQEAAAAAAEEAKRLGNGEVTLLYEMYSEKFPIIDGSTTAEAIDDTYCLTYVMPNCLIHLSKFDSKAKRAKEDDPTNTLDIFVPEEPRGTYRGLIKDTSYYVYIEQEADQLKRDQQLMAARARTMEGFKDPSATGPLTKDDGRGFESCSCSEGAPCVDEYGCKDWCARFAVAAKNGWKGF